jgi:PAS domain-containing protein
MHRFIEKQNIARLERLLASEGLSDKSRHLVEEQWLAAHRRLAALTAVNAGVKSGSQYHAAAFPRYQPKITSRFRKDFEAAPMPLLLLDPGPGMRIVHANQAYAAATMINPGRAAGEKLFNVFPDNPADPLADGAANVFDSLRIVAETGQSHAMAVQRYDVRNPEGAFVERYWRPVNSPVLDDKGGVAFILNQVIDVTSRFPRRAPLRQNEAGSLNALPGQAARSPSRQPNPPPPAA